MSAFEIAVIIGFTAQWAAILWTMRANMVLQTRQDYITNVTLALLENDPEEMAKWRHAFEVARADKELHVMRRETKRRG